MTKGQLASIIYHEIFSFSLFENELARWEFNSKLVKSLPKYSPRNNFVLRRAREKTSQRKLEIAQKAGEVLRKIPTVEFVGITGSLSMMNAKPASDIDFLIITSPQSMWITRFFSYALLKASGFAIRNPKNKNERDKLCLNMWMEYSDLKITKKNLYTAHEILQIVPLVNKNKTHERFINQNKWAFTYWPNALSQEYLVASIKYQVSHSVIHNTLYKILNTLAYKLQRIYMSKKITKEFVNEKRAFFHPFDWGEKVIKALDKAKVRFVK